MYRCGTAAFRSSSSDWKRRATTDAQTLNEYAELFGSDQAPAPEASTAGGAYDSSHAVNGDAVEYESINAHQNGGHEEEEDLEAQPPAKKRKIGKKAAAAAEADAADVSHQPVLSGDSLAPVKEKKKGKKGKKADDAVNDGASVLGTELADAPWANEQVAALPESENLGQDISSTGKKQKRDKSKQSQQNKGNSENRTSVPNGTTEAMAFLGFASAQSASKQKKEKAKRVQD